jgi:predicted HD superfamily hydrolase involved in NAD metabolism
MNTAVLNNARKWIKERLSEERYLHSVGSEETAAELAEKFSENIEKAAFAALIHDNAKHIPYDELLKFIQENNFEIEEDVKYNRKILHAHVGACFAQKELGVSAPEVLNAVKYHTTGRADMTTLEKIVFLADKIEPYTREKEFIKQVNNILNETNNINKAVLFCLENTLRSLIDRKLPINHLSFEAWNFYLNC